MEPGVNNLGPTGDGKIASDFPIIQYAVAQVWKVTGVSTMVYRFVDLLFLTLGLYYCFKLFSYWFKENYVLAILMTGIIYTSTILAYYGPTSLSDIQAFGLSCTAFYYFILWLDKKQYKYIIIAVLVFAFAGLLKMSSAFIYMIALAYLVTRLLFGKAEDKKGLLSLFTIPLLFLPFIPWYAWYTYVYEYNQIHNNGFFLIGILPFWKIPMAEIYNIINGLFWSLMLPSVFNIQLLFLLFLVVGAFLGYHIKAFFTETYLRLLIPVLVFASYMVLFFEVFKVHDYYFLNMIPILIIVVGLMINHLLNKFPHLIYNKKFILGLCLLLVVLTFQTALNTRARIEMSDDSKISRALMKKSTEDFYNWNTFYDRSRYEILERITEETLDSIGITNDKQVLCLGDLTINRGLYLIDRLGYSSFGNSLESAPQFIEEKKQTGLYYLILIEPDWLTNEGLKPYLKNKVYEKDGTSIYKL